MGGGGSLCKIFFFQSEHVSSQIRCQKFFPFTGGGGGPSAKIVFQSEHVSSQIWCQNFFPLLGGGGGPSVKFFFSSLNMYQAKSGVKNFHLYCGLGTPHPRLGLDLPPPAGTGNPPPIQGWDWDPPHPRLDRDPPPPNVNRLKLLPSPILRMAGGKNECIWRMQTLSLKKNYCEITCDGFKVLGSRLYKSI